MAQEIEIEYKNLLSCDEFDRILTCIPFPTDGEKQINYYFETKDFLLKKQSCALRIREKNKKYALTLKEPHTDGLLETHDTLTKMEADALLKGNPVCEGHIWKRLQEMCIPPDKLEYFGSLTTIRREVEYRGVLLVLDYSTYNGTSDFELELEAPDAVTGRSIFALVLDEYQIPKRKTPAKIARFFSTLSVG